MKLRTMVAVALVGGAVIVSAGVAQAGNDQPGVRAEYNPAEVRWGDDHREPGIND